MEKRTSDGIPSIFELLTKLGRSRWLDIGQVLSSRVYAPRLPLGPAWSIKDLLFGFRENFSRGTRRIVPSG